MKEEKEVKEIKGRRRLPSGFGTIRNLGKGRRRPFAVHPPAVVCSTEAGRSWRRPSAISYVSTWENGLKMLALYHAGEYHSGMESVLDVLENRESKKKEGSPDAERGWTKTGRCIAADIPATREELRKYGLEVGKEINSPLIERKNEDTGRIGSNADSSIAGNIADTDIGRERDYSVHERGKEIGEKAEKNNEETKAGEGTGKEKEEPEAGVKAEKKKEEKEAGEEAEETGDEKGKGVGKTFARVYEAFFQYQYGPHARKTLSKSTRNATKAAYRHFAPLYDRLMEEITVDDLQEIVNAAAGRGYSRSSVNRMVTLAHQIYRYAWPRDLCSKESGRYVEMPGCLHEKHHQAFTDEELAKIWREYRDSKNPVLGMILLMCYSGFRVGEYESDNFSLRFSRDTFESAFFCGGFKTEAGRDRIVPVHSGVLPLMQDMLDQKGVPVFFAGRTSGWFREEMKKTLVRIGIDHDRRSPAGNGDRRYHTPHSCRHTFSRLCESSGVNEADRKRLLGHSFGHDITNGVYGHRSVEELRAEIEKIEIP